MATGGMSSSTSSSEGEFSLHDTTTTTENVESTSSYSSSDDEWIVENSNILDMKTIEANQYTFMSSSNDQGCTQRNVHGLEKPSDIVSVSRSEGGGASSGGGGTSRSEYDIIILGLKHSVTEGGRCWCPIQSGARAHTGAKRRKPPICEVCSSNDDLVITSVCAGKLGDSIAKYFFKCLFERYLPCMKIISTGSPATVSTLLQNIHAGHASAVQVINLKNETNKPCILYGTPDIIMSKKGRMPALCVVEIGNSKPCVSCENTISQLTLTGELACNMLATINTNLHLYPHVSSTIHGITIHNKKSSGKIMCHLYKGTLAEKKFQLDLIDSVLLATGRDLEKFITLLKKSFVD